MPVNLAGPLATYSPEWWLKRLLGRLASQRTRTNEYAEFHAGRQRLAFASERFWDTFGPRYGKLPANFMPRVVDAERDRLQVVGFRYGDQLRSDEAVWDIWQRNQLDAESYIAHELALVKGIAFTMVAPSPDGALITIEDPAETVVESVPGNRRKRAAGLKLWLDDDLHLRTNLFLPEAVYRWRSTLPQQVENEWATTWTTGEASTVTWDTFTADDLDAVVRNPLGVVPIVPLVNRPRRDGSGVSEIPAVMGNQLAINKLRFDALVAAEAVAFPQRWFTNIDIPVDEDTGKPVAPFKPGIDVLWGVRRPTAEEVAEYGDKVPEPKFGQFEQASLDPYIAMIRQETIEMAAISATPYYQLVGPPTAVAPSGESVKSAEAPLVRKTDTAMAHFGEGWEETMRLAGEVDNAPVPADGETMWASAETRSDAVKTDAIIKQHAAGLIPTEFALEELGYSQQEIRRIMAMQESEAATAPTPALPTNGVAVPSGAGLGPGLFGDGQ